MKLRRERVAFGISVALHCALLMVLARRRPQPRATPPRPPIAIQLRTVPRQEVPAPLPPQIQPKQPAPESQDLARGTRKPSHRQAPVEGPKSRDTLPNDAPVASVPLKEDSPRAIDLVPGIQTWGGFSKPAPAPESHGQTVQNTPQERPDPQAVAALNAERVKRRVDTWIKDDVASLRVEKGLVDHYFGNLKKALEQAAANPPKFDAHVLRNFFADWSSAAQRYGAGRNPYGQDDGSSRGGEFVSPLSRARQEAAGTRYEDFADKLGQGSALRRFAEGGAALFAVVELRQSATGELLTSLLIQSSGNKAFDEHVMRSAPQAILQLPSPKPGGAGIHSDGLRSEWAFEGRVLYKKKLKDMHLKDDWWYLAVSSPLALVTGNFDETNGDVYVVDLRDPKYTCTVRLLRVY